MIFEKVKFWELWYIWIDKQFRNKWLSSKIKNIIFNWFKEKNCKFVKLSVLNKNPAKKIYMKWWFETILCDMKKLI
jgi:GNAT superfamily N-acetyltransferase